MSYGFLYGVGKYLRRVGIMCAFIGGLVGFIAFILVLASDVSGSVGIIFKISFKFAAVGIVCFIIGIIIDVFDTIHTTEHESENNNLNTRSGIFKSKREKERRS